MSRRTERRRRARSHYCMDCNGTGRDPRGNTCARCKGHGRYEGKPRNADFNPGQAGSARPDDWSSRF